MLVSVTDVLRLVAVTRGVSVTDGLWLLYI